MSQMLEIYAYNVKISVINMIKTLTEKVDSIQDQVCDFSEKWNL